MNTKTTEHGYKHLRPYTRPDSYSGPTWYGYFGVAGRSRDSTDLELSNWDQFLSTLGGETGESEDRDEDDRNMAIDSRDNLYISDVIIVRDSHWAVGWIETLYIHSRRVDLCQIADRLLGRLEDYPILDEDDYSNRQWETATTTWAGMSIADRVEAIHRHGCARISIFSARRPYVPENDDNGGIFDYLTTP